MTKDMGEFTISRDVVREQVVRQVCRDPGTLICAGLGVLLLAGGTLMGAGMGAAVAGSVLIPGGFFFNYRFRHSQFAKKFMDDVAEALDRKRRRRMGEIRADLYDLAKYMPAGDEAGDLASQALHQFGQIHNKFELFLKILCRKLHPGELAHARYLGTADQFFMKVIEHLSRTGEALQVVSHSESAENRQDRIEMVKKLLSQNAEALAAFDRTTSGMTSMSDLDTSQAEDLKIIKEQLDELARQAERLGKVQ